LHRLKAYEETGVDWVQMQAPHSVEEIKQGRAVVSGPFSFHNGNLPRIPTRKEHLEIGVNIAWHAGFASTVTYIALWDFLKDFQERDVTAWEDLQQKHKDNPFRRGLKELRLSIGEGTEKQRELEKRYFSK
jgi:2-methylisocitrate lyase-like PEP mutase family enzyme